MLGSSSVRRDFSVLVSNGRLAGSASRACQLGRNEFVALVRIGLEIQSAGVGALGLDHDPDLARTGSM